jgi:hypothetical protein
MPYGTGLDGSIGFGVETTWGTAVTPTKFLPLNNESIKIRPKRVASTGLRNGAAPMALSASYRTLWTDAGGQFNLDVTNKSMGLLFKSMLGTSATTNSGAVYTHTYTMGTTIPAFTTQVGRASSDGTVNKFTYSGCKVADWELSLSTDAPLQLTATIDGKAETSATSGLTTPSYSDPLETFTFADSTVLTLDGATVAAVKKLTIKGANPLANERVYLVSAGTKAEQVVNGFRAVSGTLEADFTSKAALYDSFTAKTELTLASTLASTTIIASATPFSIAFAIPALYLEGETPSITGPDILSMSIPFTVFYDGTNSPFTITYVTSDTAAT